MEFLSTRMFWGIIIMLIGLYVILNAVFKINFPVFRILLACFLIYLGFKILYGSFNTTRHVEGRVQFSEGRQSVASLKEFNKFESLFGNQEIDLSMAELSGNRTRLKFDCVFGRQVVKLPQNANVQVKASAVFASIDLPNGNRVSFGDYQYQNALNESLPVLEIDANCVFGSILFIK